MAYKRNPMRSERICSLARFVMSLPANAANTHATQWFERTLDDSANRRISIPEAFLGTDAVLSLVYNVMDGIIVWPKMIEKRVEAELPFMATENILMAAVKAGGDRQELHEVIRVSSMEAAKRIKEEGASNDLLERIKKDKAFAGIADRIDDIVDPKAFVGRAPDQVEEFVNRDITPLLKKYEDLLANDSADEIIV
jgi:adenylosuccinate lyase